MQRIPVQTQGVIGRMADYLMVPIMYFLQGNISESPQRTHRWNNQHLRNMQIADLHADKIEIVPGVPGAHRRWLGPIPLFHMPLFGGWKKFVVLQPKLEIPEWYVGWIAFDTLGVSKVPLSGPVRLGVGPRQAQFFGVNHEGEQIDIDVIGEGYIGQAGEFSKIPLL